MANRFYVPGRQRASKVADLFDSIARRYDLINDLQSFGLHRLWKQKLVRLAEIRPGKRALDLCCGSGDVAFALARAGARVAGLDFSGPMLEVAERRRHSIEAAGRKSAAVRESGITAVSFVCGDCLSLPFEDASFDVVTISYGLRNLASVEDGLREMLRVARPAARLLVLDFGKPQNAMLRGIYFAYLKRVVPQLGRIFCGDAEAYAYILDSLEHYAGQDGVAQLMSRLNCEKVSVFNLLGGAMGINYGEKPSR